LELRPPAPRDPATAVIAGRRVASTLAEMGEPTVLVLDHTDRLDRSLGRETIAEIAEHLPPGSQLAVAARHDAPVPVALLRASGEIMEIGADDLAMDEREASALLEGADVRLAQAEMAELVRCTEGWPVGLYFAALAFKDGGSDGRMAFPFTGDDRLMADYLRSELLDRLSPSTVSFLAQTSVLDRMCGPLCDAVAETTGSSRRLESLERSCLLLVPLDRQRSWYRYHHLFRDLLRSELDRLEPRTTSKLHARAAAWCETNGEPEMAIGHAQAAGDASRLARLVLDLTYRTYAAGRVDTCRGWLQWFEDRHLIEEHQPIAVLGSLVHTLVGEPAAADMWAAAAERGSYDGTLRDGSTIDAWLALLRAFQCREGVRQMRRDAQTARDGPAPTNPWRPKALLREGISYVVEGEADIAEPILTRAFDAAAHIGTMPAASVALAERALVRIQHDDWAAAETLTQHALAIVRSAQLDGYGSNTLVHALAARIALHRQDTAGARESAVRAARARPALTYATPCLSVQARLQLARAYLELADATGAQVVLREARDILQLRPDLGVLPQQADELGSKLAEIRAEAVGTSMLTAAELRLLPQMATHLSFREIAERLYVSRHTIKTQAISVYRKLGVASRSEAIKRVRQLGLLGD
jgi:LuxR family transcriptional regulator, maltose regulon positive regulatory protein